MTAARRVRRAAAVLAVLAATSACGDDGGASPAFDAVDMATGDEVSSNELQGRPTLLAAFATWCAPCERELPLLEEALPEIEAAGVRVVAVNVDAPGVGDDEVAAMIERLAPSLAVWRDDESAILMAYEATFMPFSVLIDADGSVVQSWSGALDPTSDDFRDAIAAA